MCRFTYENQGMETMLVYHMEKGETLDEFSRGMLQENEIAGVLRPSFAQKDAERYVKYPVTSRVPLKDFISGEMERNTVLKIFQSVSAVMKEIDEYMLNPEKLLLDPEYMFVDIRKKEVSLVYLPVDEFSQRIEAREFMLETLSHMRFRPEEELSYVAKLVNFLNQPKPWSFDELKRYVERLLNERQPVSHDRLQKAGSGDDRSIDSEKKAGKEVMASAPPRPETRENAVLSDMQQPAFGGFAAPDISEASPVYTVPMKENTEAEKKKVGLFGKKEKKEKSGSKKKGLFAGRTGGTAPVLPGGPEIPGGPRIPGEAGASVGSVIPGEPAASGAGIARETFEPLGEIPGHDGKKKKGFLGLGKKKEVKPPVVPITPAIPQADVPAGTGYSPAPVFPAGLSSENGARLQPASDRYTASGYKSRTEEQEQRGIQDGNETVFVGVGSSEDENRTVIMGGGEEYDSTVLLGEKSSREKWSGHVVRVIRRRTGQSVRINRETFRIGSAGDYVDFYIADNPAIGGWHADITESGGAWYIMDRNSANHTYVNGIMVQPMQPVLLNNGSIITLADEDFDFIIS